MPKTAPPLLKSKRVVVSLSPTEYERWEYFATQHEMRVPEFVRYLIGLALRGLDKQPADPSPRIGPQIRKR